MWMYIYVLDICMYICTYIYIYIYIYILYIYIYILRHMYVYKQRDGLGGKALQRSSLSMALVHMVSLPSSHYNLGKEILR